MQVVVGEIRPEFVPASDLMSPYSDLVWGGEKVPADIPSWLPVVEWGDTEEIMLESLQTAGERWGWGATSAIRLPRRVLLVLVLVMLVVHRLTVTQRCTTDYSLGPGNTD